MMNECRCSGYLRKMEEAFCRLDDVTILHLDKNLRANIFEFILRHPGIMIFVDDDSVYICPTRKSLDKFRELLTRREKRISQHYQKIRLEYESTVSLLESVNRYYGL